MYNLNPKDIQKAMKRFGIKQDELEALEVIIKCKGKDIVIKEPVVSRIHAMGNETFQVSGQINEVEKNTEPEITDDDINTVVSHTSCTREQAVNALEKSKGNIAEAIMSIQS